MRPGSSPTVRTSIARSDAPSRGHPPGAGFDQPLVLGAAAEQLGMRADIDDPAAIHHHDPVGDLERVEFVSDEEDRAALHELPQDLVDVGLARGVDGAGELVEDQDARVAEDGPREGDLLFLAAGEVGCRRRPSAMS